MTDQPTLAELEVDLVHSERIQAAARALTCDLPDDFPYVEPEPVATDPAGLRRALIRFAAVITAVACAAALFLHFAKHWTP